MKQIVFIILAFSISFSFAQDKDKEKLLTLKKANDLVYQANELLNEDDYVSAEMAYRKAISELPQHVAGAYNLGSSYYKTGNYNEALYRLEQVVKNANSKAEKHKAFHNIGNILMQNKSCKEAVEAFKNALRNNPSDDETRYNLGIAKDCAEQQQDQQDQENQQDEEKKDEDKEKEEQKDKEGENKEDQKDEGEKDKKEGEDQKDDEGKPEEKENEDGKGENDKKEEKKPQPKPGQLSPQQIKNLLEAMNNQEQKVQERINAEKTKGVQLQTEKDW